MGLISQVVQQATSHTHSNQVERDDGGTDTYYNQSYANGATMVSQSVTTTKSTLVLIVASISMYRIGAKTVCIRRGGVDKTAGSQGAGAPLDTNNYVVILWGTERLAAGTYQYDLVNNSGGTIYSLGSAIKIFAIEP